MLKKSLHILLILCCCFMGIGCATVPLVSHSFPAMEPVPPPSPSHSLKVDNLLVISDVSRSMHDGNKIGAEKALLTSFNQGIPKGLKNSAMRNFGRSAYYHTELVQSLQKYERKTLAKLIGQLKAGCGNTPLAAALNKAGSDLEESKGNIGILIVSDGENISRDPIEPTLALKEIYGKRLCIYTVHVGESAAGRALMKEIADYSECGMAASAGELASKGGMKAFITKMFYAGGGPLDTDRDGVLDQSDKCPDTPSGVKVDKNGCPLDSDGDGVYDYKDKCPDTPKEAKVDSDGCPLDSDGDGVYDYKDKCPDTPKGAPVNAAGCWSLRGINFDSNKADIKPQYYDFLNENVAVLQKNPTIKIKIMGHTDSIGSDEYNQALSERRAKAIEDYFISKGVDPNRIFSQGFGESKPVASNDTPEGRSKNRRIEIGVTRR
jgi:OOP family OmpA-OmpF porin